MKKSREVQSEKQLSASIQAHKESLKGFAITCALTSVILIAIVAFIARGGFGWFVSNNRVGGGTAAISAAGQADFALATVGKQEQGMFDGIFHLTPNNTSKETFHGVDYYIASGNSSFRLDSDKNFNNYLANADLRPGNRGHFDLYVICRTEKRELELQPVFSALRSDDPNITEADFLKAKEFLRGHILLFANMDDKGMYSGNIDYTKEITVDLSKLEATQDGRTFSWGEQDVLDGSTVVYRLPIYWVWPEQFGNFIYKGNAYNKNLFADTDDPEKETDYKRFITLMESDATYNRFFFIEGEAGTRPKLETITSPTDYQDATKNYELYSGWYNAADDQIGECISYIQLGFEIAQGNTP